MVVGIGLGGVRLMSGIVRGLTRGVRDLAGGIAQASDRWPRASAEAARMRQQMEIEKQRRADAKLRNQELMDYRGDQLLQRYIEMELRPIEAFLAENERNLADAVENGRPYQFYVDERQRWLAKYNSVLTRNATSSSVEDRLPRTDMGETYDIEAEKAGMLAPEPVKRPEPTPTPDTTPDTTLPSDTTLPLPLDTTPTPGPTPAVDPYASMAASGRARRLSEHIEDVWNVAARSPETALRLVEQRMGTLTDAEREETLEQLTTGKTKIRHQFIPALNIWVDPINQTITQGPTNSPALIGEMTQVQADEANRVFKAWDTAGRIPNMWTMAVLTHASGYEGYKAQSAMGDIPLLYSFAKIVAPDDSAVREGEFKTMELAMGWFREKRLLPERIMKGDRLDPEARREMWMVIDDIKRSRTRSVSEYTMLFKDMMESRKLEPKWVIPGWDLMSPNSMELTETDRLMNKFSRLQNAEGADPGSQGLLDMEDELRRRFGVLKDERLLHVYRQWKQKRAANREWVIKVHNLAEENWAKHRDKPKTPDEISAHEAAQLELMNFDRDGVSLEGVAP